MILLSGSGEMLIFVCMDTLPHLPAVSLKATLPPACEEARENRLKKEKKRRSLQRHLFVWKEGQHTAGLFTTPDLLD